MEDFLKRFGRPLTGIRRTPTREAAEVRAILTRNPSGGYSITLADQAGKPVDAHPEEFSGDMAELVRIYNEATYEGFDNFDWSGENGASSGADLAEYPTLIQLLRRTGNLYDSTGNLLDFSDSICPLSLRIHPAAKESNEGNDDTDAANTLAASLEIELTDDASVAVHEFVTDSCVLVGRTLFSVKSVGANFRDLTPFLQPFSRDDIEIFLSMFMSYFADITPRVEGFKFITSKTAEHYVPTIVIDKIDSDKSLYVRVTSTCRSLPDNAAHLGLTFVVKRDDDLLSGHELMAVDMAEPASHFMSIVKKSAPDRASAKEIYAEGDLYILPEKVASSFLFNHLPSLLGQYRVIGADKLKSYKVRPVMPKLSMTLSSGINFLEGKAEVEIGDEKFSLADLIKRYSAHHYVQLSDGDRAIIDPDYMRRLERIYRHNRGKKGEFKISFFDLPEIEHMLRDQVKGSGLKACRKVYEGFARLPKAKLTVPGLKGTLRPYQKEGVKWIDYLYQNNLGGCLADDMGLGKTIQTISMLLKIYPAETSPTLIVMPRSLIFNWERELDRFAPTLTHATYYGTDRNLEECLKSQVVLSTYAVVRNDIERLKDVEFQYVILDESQNIKNTDALVTRAIWLLNGRHRLAISGTPIENNLTELYSLFRFLNPTMFGSVEEFNASYTYPIQKQQDELAASELRRKIHPFILRRLKSDVLKDLPALIEHSTDVEMEPGQAALYERRRAYYYDRIQDSIRREGMAKSQFLMLQALTELRRIASVPESLSEGKVHSAKMPELIEKLTDLSANGHKTVVFFNFVAGIEMAGEHLEKLGIDYETMTGATTRRKEVIDRFQNDPDCHVLLMTLKTGGVGLNLTVADTVIIYEPWWNAAAERQGINRLHRIGQKKKVLSISIYTAGTIEEKIRELQEKKSMLVDEIISSDAGAFKQLSEEDIDFILG